MLYKFQPDIKTVGVVTERYKTKDISHEPMLFSADLDFAFRNGGPITKHVLCRIIDTEEFQNALSKAKGKYSIVVDTRSTMTMKGMYPSIPGWHCDDVPRGEKYSQPDLTKVDNRVQHFMILLSDNTKPVSRTEFVSQPYETDIDEKAVWTSLDKAIENDKPKTSFLKEGDIIKFTQTAIHRASLTENPGWRFFLRVSVTHRKPVNELRHQVQVYVTQHGW